jgi:hypothetical protein
VPACSAFCSRSSFCARCFCVIETTMLIYNWARAASQQSQVPIIFSLATIALAVTLRVMGLFFWFLFVKLDTR